ncbi:energy transducer TonB (plasmid) [Phyllobacterium sp. 628]|uniref:TonB family protein n=1 Tax=Phyllobacterium sp. 628 TaxID=2718938 RepID=UPI001662360C|nr:TonB family protein [Phyllobacterium sp. 628]QND54983.1 energy transducer TonB [Phyllobacterium sp. 628]
MPVRPIAPRVGQFKLSWREVGLWSAAGLVMIGVHAGAGWYGFNYQADASDGEVAAAVMIDMEPLPAPVVPEAVAETPPVEPEKVTPEPVQEAMAPEIQPEKPLEPVEEPVPEEQAIPEEIQPEKVVELPKVEVPLPVVRPEQKNPDQPKKDVPKKVVRKPVKPQVATVKAEAVQEAKSQPSVSRSASAAEAQQWNSKLNRHLARYKRTVKIDARGNIKLSVRLLIGADGTVQSATIGQSSGNAEYDQAAIAMVQRASPLPAPPEGIGKGAQLKILPFSF